MPEIVSSGNPEVWADIANDICKKLVDLTTVEVPHSLVEERINSFKGQYEAQAKAYGISLEQLLMFQGLTLEQFNDQIEKNAYEQAKFNLVASKVMEVEKVENKVDDKGDKKQEIKNDENKINEENGDNQ